MAERKRLLGSLPNGIVVALTLILVAQVALSRAVSIDEQQIASPRLEELPLRLGTWNAAGNGQLDANVEQYLKPDSFIIRDYASSATVAPINLFIAYFKSLQNSYGPHSPKVCLPGSGWIVRSATVAQVQMPNRPQTVPVNLYEMERDGQRIMVLYWYQNQRKVWAEEFQAKLFLLPDLLRYRQFDVSLIRIITPLSVYPSSENAKQTTIQFAQTIFPPLSQRLASAQATTNQ